MSTPNNQQWQAITTTDGPLLIIAGPGSGKTFTLVERIVHLITTRQVKPEQIMIVTFTDKAAQELTTRIAQRLLQLTIPFNLNEMYLGTFHAICLRWLQEFRDCTRLKHSFSLMDQFDQQYFLYERLSRYTEHEAIATLLGSATRSAWDSSEKLLRLVNHVAEEALNPADLLAAPDEEIRALGQCATLYQTQLAEANALDFSTIQYEALRLLQGYPEVIATLRARIAYFMVDEYQDTNTIQERILLTLVDPERPNLCVVGDDDQGLYRFRGASIRNILQFADIFPGGCVRVELTTNYRSHPDIIAFYNAWMAEQNWEHGGQEFRYQKQILPRAETFPAMPTVARVGAPIEQWHDEVLAFLTRLRDGGQLTDWNQVAFLFSSVKHASARSLATFLEAHAIPVYSPRANQFFDRREVRLILGALIAVFPQFEHVRKWNAEAYLGIWEYYDEHCFRLFMQELKDHPQEHRTLARWVAIKRVEHNPLTHNTDYAFSGLFYELMQFPLFSQFLDESLLKNGLQGSRPMRNLAIFSQLLNKFEYLHHINIFTVNLLEKHLRNLFNQFLRFLQDGGIDEYEDEADYAPTGHISFLTIHQSKGLEFPVVIVDSLYNTPRKTYDALDEKLANGYLHRPTFEPLEHIKFYDFRRLYYTAFSRAQNFLLLTAPEKTGRGSTPSAAFSTRYQALPSWNDPQIDLAALPLATVKRMVLKQQYSFTSDLTVYENCAEQYRFFRELAFAPVRRNAILFGTLIHQTIEDIHKAVLRGEQARLSPDHIQSWFDVNYAQLTRRERIYLNQITKENALEHVLRYFRRADGDWSSIRQAEVDVSLVKDEYILQGKIDLIAGVGNTVELIDFKSERKLDVNDLKDRKRLDQYKRQLEVYAHIVEQRYGLVVSRTHLYYTGETAGNPYITFAKDARAIDQTIATFDAVVHRIETRDFRIPARPAKLCEGCDIRHYCDAKNWTFRSES